MMLDDGPVIGSNQCLCVPKAELKTKNSTKRQLCCRLVEFLVFNSIYLKISVPSNWRNRVNEILKMSISDRIRTLVVNDEDDDEAIFVKPTKRFLSFSGTLHTFSS